MIGKREAALREGKARLEAENAALRERITQLEAALAAQGQAEAVLVRQFENLFGYDGTAQEGGTV